MFEQKNKKNIDFSRISDKGHEIVNEIPFVKKRRRFKLGLRLLKSGFFISFVFLLFLLFFVILNVFQLKKAYTSLTDGKDQLFQSVEYTKKGNYKLAYTFSNEAAKNFRKANDVFEGYLNKKYISLIPTIKTQISDIRNLVSSVQVLSSAMSKITKIAAGYKEIATNDKSYTDLSEQEKYSILKLLYESGPEINGIKANVDLAVFHLEKLHYSGLLKFFETEVKEYEQKLIYFQPLIEKAVPMLQVLPSLLGYPSESTFLVLLQNSDELRPTGGFLGTYGILQNKNGDIKRFDTHDIYHMDMPVKDSLSVEPPKPLKKYLGVPKWFMRDANWSPDWPTAAKQIEWFFYKEDELLTGRNRINNFTGEFDGVIAISPDYIIELLKFTGPMIVDGQSYNEENFMDLLQYKVERGYIQLGVPAWERKEVIGEVSKNLKLDLLGKSVNDLLQISAITNDSLNKKNILFYFKDKELQSISEDFNWAGVVKDTRGDYIYVVDANMAALKTDAVIKRTMEYKVEQDVGGLFSRLNISYAHNGSFDWKTTRYRTYTRIYLPDDVNVLNVEGLAVGEEYEVYKEFDKTVEAGFFSLEPGEIGSIKLYYKLPENILQQLKDSSYSLLIQKQSGKEVEPLNVNLHFMKNIKEYLPTGFFVNKENETLKWETDLQTDREFSVKF